jgi:hypothetical protein
MTVQVGVLRVEPTKNGQAKGLRWACDYILGKGGHRELVQVGTEAFIEVPASGAIMPS